jgi:hypothetical protein
MGLRQIGEGWSLRWVFKACGAADASLSAPQAFKIQTLRPTPKAEP